MRRLERLAGQSVQTRCRTPRNGEGQDGVEAKEEEEEEGAHEVEFGKRLAVRC